MKTVLAWLFGCLHRRTSFPRMRRDEQGRRIGEYVVCLDCGQEFPYDWQQMKVMERMAA